MGEGLRWGTQVEAHYGNDTFKVVRIRSSGEEAINLRVIRRDYKKY